MTGTPPQDSAPASSSCKEEAGSAAACGSAGDSPCFLALVRELSELLNEQARFAIAIHTALRNVAAQLAPVRMCRLLVARGPNDSLYLLGNSEREIAPGTIVDRGSAATVTEALAAGRPVLHQARQPPHGPSEGGDTLALPLTVAQLTFGALELQLVAGKIAAPELREGLDTLAAVLASHLYYSEEYRSIRDRTWRRSRTSVERMLDERALDKHRGFFEGLPDGIAVLDKSGHVLYLNPAAAQISGYAAAGVMGRPLVELVVERDRRRFGDTLNGIADHRTSHAFEFGLLTSKGEAKVVSASARSPAAGSSLLILSFRDVTEDCALVHELRHANEFLERAIDSTANAVIVADAYGKIILFNKYAERILGRSADDVIGRMTIDQIHSPGASAKLRRQLEGPEHGGVGRLENVRAEVADADGAILPVQLSATMIHEEGREVGTVTAIRDLREHLDMEQRLAHTQEKLLESEKQSMIVALAGTTAHELNQPLTSVMGYAELLQRRLDADDSNQHAAAMIVQEAQRMAEIVRKVGRITHYETKAYVGETQILDLDKSSVPRGEPQD